MLILLSEVIISDHQRLYNIKIIFECDIVEGYSEGEKKKKDILWYYKQKYCRVG